MADFFRTATVKDLDLEIVQGAALNWPIQMFATDPLAGDYLIDTTGYSAAFAVRDEDHDGAIVLSASTGGSTIIVGFQPAKWTGTTVYGLGQQVVPTTLNGFVYEVTTAGTSGGGEPTWPTTIGGTVVDGTVTWTAVESDQNVANVYVQIAEGTTDALTDWGKGVYSLQVEDTFGHVLLHIDGVARLRRKANE
jgi:hypothetical protein